MNLKYIRWKNDKLRGGSRCALSFLVCVLDLAPTRGATSPKQITLRYSHQDRRRTSAEHHHREGVAHRRFQHCEPASVGVLLPGWRPRRQYAHHSQRTVHRARTPPLPPGPPPPPPPPPHVF